MQTVYIGLGSNLSSPQKQVLQAIKQIKGLQNSLWISSSSLYLTPPWGMKNQPPFINAVVKIATLLEPMELLQALLVIEKVQGRVRDVRYGPRTIDCDILLFGQQQIATEHLCVPHPRMLERAFVMVPLHEIAPELILSTGQCIADVILNYQNVKIEKLTLLSEEVCDE
jgi:2-amino-4-hydroxy-6-hydroxymethyldihydropteridine diphosphokinase